VTLDVSPEFLASTICLDCLIVFTTLGIVLVEALIIALEILEVPLTVDIKGLTDTAETPPIIAQDNLFFLKQLRHLLKMYQKNLLRNLFNLLLERLH
jgi:RNA 3'-terminal phosphate cyclase